MYSFDKDLWHVRKPSQDQDQDQDIQEEDNRRKIYG